MSENYETADSGSYHSEEPPAEKFPAVEYEQPELEQPAPLRTSEEEPAVEQPGPAVDAPDRGRSEGPLPDLRGSAQEADPAPRGGNHP